MIKSPVPTQKLQQHFDQADIIGGYDLGLDYPDMENCLLFCVTETRAKEEIDRLVAVLKEVQA